MMKKALLIFILFIGFFYNSNAQCPNVASFSFSGSFLSKSFFNSSTCLLCTNTWSWDFGDGSPVSTIFNPIHTYLANGTYTVCLTMTSFDQNGNVCIDTACTTFTATGPTCTATAGFTATSAGLTANFTNTSICASCNTSTVLYKWNFDDGSPISNSISPTHTYANPGIYNVCLILQGSFGTSTITCIDTFCNTITVLPTGGCGGNSSFTSAQTGLSFLFNSTSVCLACVDTSYLWNFGDGSLPDTNASVTHNYSLVGTYNVCLTTTGKSPTGTICVDSSCVQLNVAIPIECSSTASFNYSNIANTVAFVNASTCTTCTAALYKWDFGDGNTSPWNSPVHTYSANGVYNVCLVATGLAANQSICRDSLCQVINVTSVGIEDIIKTPLSVYPNPTSNKVMIELPSNEIKLRELQIADVTGRRLKTISLSDISKHEFEVDLSSFNTGVYLIQVIGEQSRYKAQVIKQ
jgi:PKD repeat protein